MSNILVLLESNNNSLKRVSLELITAANSLSAQSGAKIYGLLIDADGANAAISAEYGLANVIVAKTGNSQYSSTTFSSVVAQVAKNINADVLLFAANAAGLEIAPRVAVKLSAGYIADCTALNFDNNDIINRGNY